MAVTLSYSDVISPYWKAIPLTPEDQMFYDRSDTLRRSVLAHTTDRHASQSQLTTGFGSIEDWKGAYQVFQEREAIPKYSEFWKRDLHALTKFGPQGGDCSLQRMIPILEEYYKPRQFHRTAVLDVGCQYLRRALARRIERKGLVPVYEFRPTYRSSSGSIPNGGRKGDYHTETGGANLIAIQHPFPEQVGFRRMKGSDRVIFNSATPNVRQLEWVMTPILHWLRSEFPEWFGSWLHPSLSTRPIATRICMGNHYVCGFDFTKCDQHTSLQLIENYVFPILEVLLDESSFITAAVLLTEAFKTPLYLGDWMLEGEHNLFSGQSPTQLVETIIDIEGLIGGVLCELSPGAVGECQFLAIGDDQVLSIPHKYGEKRILALRRTIIDAYNAVGHKMNEEKSEVGEGALTYCKRYYAPSMPKVENDTNLIAGAYPLAYALNSIVNPENPQPTPGRELVAILQRLDNAQGSPAYVPFVQFVGRRIDKGIEFNDVDIAAVNRSDWWQRVYGEPWAPATSPSFRIMVESGLI